ncbi:MAG: formylmethanofuran dehydrogenase subunit E family protein [Candidatus Thermoplasmatota archaeon]
MDETLQRIEKFHGHLGPYVVIGYRMGEIACQKTNSDPFKKEVEIFTGIQPPISCIIDGIQLSSGCTLGKGNIKVKNENKPSATFKDKNTDKQINIILKKNIQQKIDTQVTEENIVDFSKKIFNQPVESLFEIF